MHIFPAIDLYDGKAVRLLQGDYNKMTVYSDNPPEKAKGFAASGAEHIHIVDLNGAKDGTTANFDTIKNIIAQSGLKAEIGGGIRSEEAVARYAQLSVQRVILGTAAITQPGFVKEMVKKYGSLIAVGVDVRDGYVAIKGWTELSDKKCFDFCSEMEAVGVETIICTDISKDGVLGGTNLELYKSLSEKLKINIIASGGVSSLEDISALKSIGVYGAILGKAIYTGGIDLAEAVKLSAEE